jgi:hypothetical protein
MTAILLNRNRQVPAEETPAFGGIAERFRRAGDLERAIALCHDGLKRFPDQLSARVTLGWALLDSGQHESARVELEQVLRRAPDNLAAIRGMAELHDRCDGQLLSEEERESWRVEQAAADCEREAGIAAVAEVPEPAVTDVDNLSPIPVRFADADGPAAIELVNTADEAQQRAESAVAGAAAYSFEAPTVVAPSEAVALETEVTSSSLEAGTVFLALEETDERLDLELTDTVAVDELIVLDSALDPDLEPEAEQPFHFSDVSGADEGDEGREGAPHDPAHPLVSFTGSGHADARTSARLAALERLLGRVRTRRVALQSEFVA